MKEELREITKHSFYYSFGKIAAKSAGFILLPFYTSYLTVAEYGVLALIETTFNILLPFVIMNINAAVIRFSPTQKNEYDQKTIVSTGITFVLISFIVFNIVLQPFAKLIAVKILGSADYKYLVNILFINIGLQAIINYYKGIYNANQNSKKFSTIDIVSYSLIVILAIIFLVKFKWGLKGVLLAQTFAYASVIVVFAFEIIKNLNFKFSFEILKKMLKYSIPLAFSAISALILGFGDRYVLRFVENTNAVGIYSMAAKFANIIDLLVLGSFRLAFMPVAFKNFEKPNFKFTMNQTLSYLIFILLFFGLILSAFSKEVIFIMAPTNHNYWYAAKFIPIASLIKILGGFQFMFSLPFFFEKKTNFIPIVVIASTALNIGLNFLLIPVLSIYGALIASIISIVLIIIVYYIYGRKLYKVDYDLKKSFILILMALFVFAPMMFFGKLSFFIAIPLKIFLIGLFTIFSFYYVLSQDEREKIISFINLKILNKLKKR